jgi:hypothetical protein
MRILTISGHCQDRFTARFTDGIHSEKRFGPHYVARGLGIGGGDSIDLKIDIDTGKIIGWVTPTEEQLKEVFDNKDNE